MGSLYRRGNRWWMRLKKGGAWKSMRTPYLAADERKARRFLAALEARLEATSEVNRAAGARPDAPLTVARYASKWLAERKGLGLRSFADDQSRIDRHVLPRLGAFLLAEVGPRRIREFVLALRMESGLAPRTIHHVYRTTATMFHAAVAEELIDATPCVLPRGTLPKKVDKDPAWRATAIYAREEVEQLISDRRIPEDRRVLYALKGLAGLRHGEAAGLRWRQYDTTAEPLHALQLEKTKTGVPRRIPVHATLARVLAEWKIAGWQRTYGRPHTPDDLVVPTLNLTERSAQEAPKQLHADLEALGLRKRRGHDLRRTFITLAQVDGARRDLLETISHGPRGDIVSVYTTFPWPSLCAEVAKLKIELREGAVLEGDFGPLATELATRHARARNRWQKAVTPSGLECVPNDTKHCEEAPSPSETRAAEVVSHVPATVRCSNVARLAFVAANAVRNGDLQRALDLLEEIGAIAREGAGATGERGEIAEKRA